MRDRFYESVEALQADLDVWLIHYNTERLHLGYRNHGPTILTAETAVSRKSRSSRDICW